MAFWKADPFWGCFEGTPKGHQPCRGLHDTNPGREKQAASFERSKSRFTRMGLEFNEVEAAAPGFFHGSRAEEVLRFALGVLCLFPRIQRDGTLLTGHARVGSLLRRAKRMGGGGSFWLA